MINEKRLRELLIFSFESLQAQQKEISDLLSEVAALRDSLCAIGPKYGPILEEHRTHHHSLAKPLAALASQQYDELIHELRTVY
jgi:hypothetical protein